MSDINQKDLVLSINEYSYVLDETKGHVSCLVGPTKMSLSQSDKLVRFNERTKAFEVCSYEDAKYLFVTTPENWYCILKNPIKDNKHPTPGASNTLPENMQVGQKINVRGPASFALYPGQMAKVVKGHALRSNQYLLARVYEAAAANNSEGEVRDAEGNLVSNTEKNYVNGQILVIKGTEVSFYIPPTGIEVIPVENNIQKGYIREAITLERLEYCILKDENGSKTYAHGPQVVFPKPTENFVTSPSGGYIFRAIELSKISGIYVKVIAEYKDENEVIHPVGEELFITGDTQMIYYPRPEHAIINYDGKIMHHAIAIPEGEGRYIMDRMNGKITTVRGPAMYLPDPRTEVVVKRKLSPRQCDLWYPGNKDVLIHNLELNEKAVEKSSKLVDLDAVYLVNNDITATLSNLEAKANISRGTSYTKPRTITLDNRFDGVVSIDVWTGYAVNVISKNGTRKIVCGPQTILLDYDQTLEELQMSTGKPKTTDKLINTVYLRHENNQITDIINIETADFVHGEVKVSYCVNFDKSYKDRWFNVENYVKYLCDKIRSDLKKEAKQHTIEDFYQNYSDIVRRIVLEENKERGEGSHSGRFFPENGMYVFDCEVLSLKVEENIAEMLLAHQEETIAQNLRLMDAEKQLEVAAHLAEKERIEKELEYKRRREELERKFEEENRKRQIHAELARTDEAERLAVKQAEQDIQVITNIIEETKRSNEKAKQDQDIEYKTKIADIERTRQEAYAKTVAQIMESIGPDLVAAMSSKSNSEMTVAICEAIAPYALAKGESAADVVNKLLRGTSIEDAVKGINLNI